jgi:hypothetical protein
VLVLTLLVVLSGFSGVVGATHAPDDAGVDPGSLSELQGEFDRTEFRITVYANGSATWTVRYQQTLDNETERRDFEAFAETFNDRETPLYTDFVNRSRTLVNAGTDATGREMSAEAFARRAYVNQLGNLGVVELSFRWTAFAPVDGERVVVGDVFDGGLYIRSDQRLVFSHGPEVRFEEVAPGPDSRSGGSLTGSDSVTWSGERSFTDERPRLVLTTAEAEGGTESGGDGGAGTDEPTSTTAPTTAPETGGGPGMATLVGLLAVVVLGGAAAFAYRSGAFGASGSGRDEGGTGAETGDGAEAGVGAEAEAEVGAGNDAEASGAGPASDPDPSVPDEMLLSDEDRVMKLLDGNGGRMKQVNIVEETGWSKSKVSMLLSDMEEEEMISKLRVGRENIISKKGMEPEAARSPFEDEDGDGRGG